MWEYRLVWPSGKPSWWDEAWKHGVEALGRQQRKPEERPDLYLILTDRVDVGLKLRGSAEGDFDAKVLHARSGGWELWEKIPYFRWNELEATRFAAMAKVSAPSNDVPTNLTPTLGVKSLLQSVGLKYVEVKVEKIRVQARAGELLFSIVGQSASPQWLAELVEIRMPNRRDPFFSACVETTDPLEGGIEFFPSQAALCCGYPELLVKHLRSAL